MKVQALPAEFEQARPLLEKIQLAGFEAYFVGGAVRDLLLQRPIHDVDIATSAYPAEIKQIFRKTIDIGIEHGTVLVLANNAQYEITTYRTESSYTDFRRPDQVKFVSDLTEDLQRRDFTINALAMSREGQIVDQFDGLIDLENRVLRAVGQAGARFIEDALRIMRGIRFAAELGFELEAATLSAMTTHAELLQKISIERIFTELDKCLLATNWQSGLSYLNTTGVWQYLPDFQELDASDLTADFLFRNSVQAWAWLCLQLPDFDLKKWKVSNDFSKRVTKLVAAYQEPVWSLTTAYQYGLEIVRLADDLKIAQGRKINRQLAVDLDQALQIHHKSELAVKGADLIELGFTPGPELGHILNQLESKIVQNELANNKEEILAYVKKIPRQILHNDSRGQTSQP